MGFRYWAGQGMWPAFAGRLYHGTAAGPAPSCVTAGPTTWEGDPRLAGMPSPATGRSWYPQTAAAIWVGTIDPLDADHPGRARPGLSTVHASTADKSARALPGRRRSDAYRPTSHGAPCGRRTGTTAPAEADAPFADGDRGGHPPGRPLLARERPEALQPAPLVPGARHPVPPDSRA